MTAARHDLTRFAVLAALAVCLVAVAAGGEAIGHVIALQGTASARGADGTRRALALRAPVHLNDTIVTAPGARLQIMFSDDSILSQGERSEMVIDTYVYAPNDKPGNAAAMRLVKGLFRMVTDKITKLNPERFKVKTHMATIGIRGCDVGFRIEPGQEDILGLGLGAGETLVVNRLDETAPGPAQVEIQQVNRMLRLRTDEPMRVRPLPPDVLAAFFRRLHPQPPARTSRMQAATVPGTAGDTGATEAPTVPDVPPPLLDPPAAQRPTQQPGLEPEPQPDPEPEPEPEQPWERFTRRGGGTDWNWGIWESGVGDDPGTVDAVAFNSEQDLDDDAFARNVFNGTPRTLVGQGEAAAVVSHDGERTLVTGPCQLTVTLGKDVNPAWNSTVSMSNGDNHSCAFSAQGSVSDDGRFAGEASEYLLRVDGQAFDNGTITAQSMAGRLVGPGDGETPVTGGIAEYSFQHGPDTRVDGGFGADLGEQ
jgi:hypothetical protein